MKYSKKYHTNMRIKLTCVWALLPICRIENYNDTTEFLKNKKLKKKLNRKLTIKEEMMRNR